MFVKYINPHIKFLLNTNLCSPLLFEKVIMKLIQNEAFEIMENIRKEIEAHSFTFNKYNINVTLSGGIVEAADWKFDIQEVLHEADKLLYHAKEQGRNQFSIDYIINSIKQQASK
jgi:GGDEF domain-containing protein